MSSGTYWKPEILIDYLMFLQCKKAVEHNLEKKIYLTKLP